MASTENSLQGSTGGDNVGLLVTILPNGNFVIRSPYWDNGSIDNAGAVTWGSGTNGITGSISATDSLVGSSVGDLIGFVYGESQGLTILTNGNYVVNSFSWDNGSEVNAGAVTWGNGASGVSGVVSAANSLVGNKANDGVGGLLC